ncbi:MAG: patatin-like phospholipase family protein, partial [Xanthobacteraceae bacterium]
MSAELGRGARMKNILTALLPGRAAEQKASASTKRINLALQGGGAHGAFTWGVLDQLLSDERLSIEGISGASAGAVNAVLLADGLARGGRAEAQKRLADFWRAASSTGNLPGVQRAVMERLLSFTPLEGTPVQAWFDAMSRYFSPYDVNPLNLNPLKDLIERFVDFEALRADSDLQIFVSATNV